MSEDNSGNIPSVKVENNLSLRIKVRVDYSRSIACFENITPGISVGIPTFCAEIRGNYSSEKQASHVVPTADSFTIINLGESKTFDLSGGRDEYAFLTIWTENDDSSWTVYCENHPILRHSEISVDPSPLGGLYLSVYQLYYKKSNDEVKSGTVRVSNRSSKRIWASIDADDIEQIKRNVNLSANVNVAGFSVGGSLDTTVNNRVHYKAGQKQGYTEININERVNFYLKISGNRIYVSIDYETPSGLKTHCIYHSLAYWTTDTKRSPIIYINDFGEGITFRIKRFKEEQKFFQELIIDDGKEPGGFLSEKIPKLSKLF
ncbi:hypothetical protein FO519_009476 [Halicephalobus sp. NKZ332]|nr:hypothetical protein FO519_009476 [Halicephalobus sp. NKZ332]